MIQNYLSDIEPTISPVTGAITAIRYIAWATLGDFDPVSEQLGFILDVPADADGVFTADELNEICLPRPETQHAFIALNARLRVQAMPAYIPPVFTPPTGMAARELWAKQIDANVRMVSDEYTCFQMEYVEREAAALAYQASGFEGVPDEWVTRFADSARIPYPDAAQRILSQAVELRKAIKELGNLRMEKYSVLNADTQEAAQAEFLRILEAVRVVEANLP